MAKVCPLCNALQTLAKECPLCGQPMVDGGMLENYFGPYGPYKTEDGKSGPDDSCCGHLCYCPNCGYDERLAVSMVNI